VRQALDYATPKQAIVKSLLRGLATPAHADVPPSSFYYQPNVEPHDYNLDRAKGRPRQPLVTAPPSSGSADRPM
jgi:ABC-type transport system substrate-binding protein